jgi:capsid portal protein
MDREAIGWGAFEVIRNNSGKIARLKHVPARRLRVLKGWKGFVEKVSGDLQVDSNSLYTFYQNFGEKVGVLEDDPLNLSDNKRQVFRPYDPTKDGELEIGERNITWNLYSKHTGKPLSSSETIADAANEILYLPNAHISTVYYGFANIVPAIPAILVNSRIWNSALQFLDHNCVPRYVVIIEGAKVDDTFRKMIAEYFDKKIKGNAYKTMVLALPSVAQKNINIRFEQIDVDRKEADFLTTKETADKSIMVCHGIPPAVLAINETASLGSGKGLSQAELYKDRVIFTSQRFWARKLNNLFKIGLGVTNAYIEYDPLDVRDSFNVHQALQIALINGFMTINEARISVGLSAIEGGDEAFLRIREGSFVKVEDIPKLESVLKEALPNLTEPKNIQINENGIVPEETNDGTETV